MCDCENWEHDTCAQKVSFQAFHWWHLSCPPVKMELHCFSRDASPIEYNFLLEICTNGFVTSAHIVRLCWALSMGPIHDLTVAFLTRKRN